MSEHLQVCSLLDPSSHQWRSRPMAGCLAGTAAAGCMAGWLTPLAEWLLLLAERLAIMRVYVFICP